jgi:hypothetical protein
MNPVQLVQEFSVPINRAKRLLVDLEIGARKAKRISSLGRTYAPTWGVTPDSLAVSQKVATGTVGDITRARLYAKLAHIDRLDFPRSHHQRKFHECFIRASLRTIYGDDYQLCEERLKGVLFI